MAVFCPGTAHGPRAWVCSSPHIVVAASLCRRVHARSAMISARSAARTATQHRCYTDGHEVAIDSPLQPDFCCIEMRRVSFFGSLFLMIVPAFAGNFQLPPEKEALVANLLAQMTTEEKLQMVSGPNTGTIFQFGTRAIDRLGIPSLAMTDSPVGISVNGTRMQPATIFPTPVILASTWDLELVHKIAASIATEALAFERTALLAPIVEVVRTPQGGRNFEMFSEDPFYNARLGVASIKGVQSQKIPAVAKHLVGSGQELWRFTADVQMDDRTLREIYLPPYEAAVREAGVVGVMTAYNKFRGLWCSEQPLLINDILKGDWGFQGAAVSDWGAVHSPAAAAAGTDLEMPFATAFGEPLTKLLASGELPAARLDDMVRRILRMLAFAGLLEGKRSGDPADVSKPEHLALARQGALEGMTLLKNQPAESEATAVLPLEVDGSIAVLGPRAGDPIFNGGGCASMIPPGWVSPLMALQAIWTDPAKILAPAWGEPPEFRPDAMRTHYGKIPADWLRPPDGKPGEVGLRGEYFANTDLSGQPAVVRLDADLRFQWGGTVPVAPLPADGYSIRWEGQIVPDRRGRFFLRVTAPDTAQVFLDGKLSLTTGMGKKVVAPEAVKELTMEAGKPVDIRIELRKGAGDSLFDLGLIDIGAQVEAAKAANSALIFAGFTDRIEREIQDRDSLELPADQVALIKAVAAVNPRTVVILNTGGPGAMGDWIEEVPALVCAWYPGQEAYPALADLLAGRENFSGKTPVTWPRRWEDHPTSASYPHPDGPATYSEGLFMGYRHFDAKNVEPQFPFGHGLSYTRFALADLHIESSPERPTTIAVKVRNEGERAGATVVQIYVGQENPSVPRPVRELKGFQRVVLKPGETRELSFDPPERAFQYWDPSQNQWTSDEGTNYRIEAGFSSRDLPLSLRTRSVTHRSSNSAV